MKPFTDAQFAFKAAARRAVQMAGGCNAAALVTRADAARLSRYGNLDTPEFVPVDVAFDLDKAAGDPVMLSVSLPAVDVRLTDSTLLKLTGRKPERWMALLTIE